jgi:hypothetical protein
MRRLVVVVVAVLSLLLTAVAGVYAAPEVTAVGRPGPYEGTFRGVAYGDRGSSAPLTLDLTHRGNQVQGSLVLDEGLYVDGGFCGAVNLPATEQFVEGQTAFWKPGRMVARPAFDAGAFNLTVDFVSNISTDGTVLTAEAKIDLPWFCGRDPVLTASLNRD